MFEVQKCQDLNIYHIAAFRVCPLADDIIQDLYPGLSTDMGGPMVCTLMKGFTQKTAALYIVLFFFKTKHHRI